jgi:hypothetical protein
MLLYIDVYTSLRGSSGEGGDGVAKGPLGVVGITRGGVYVS